MDCPKCKYPNPPGVSYCQMCYEVFNRSAADSYMRNVQREKLKREKDEAANADLSGAAWAQLKALFNNADWAGLRGRCVEFLRRRRAILWGGAAALAAGCLFWFFSSPAVRFKAWGTVIQDRFPTKTPLRYLTGFQTHLKSWSEREGRLDTPLEEFQIDEIGNVLVQETPARSRKQTPTLTARAQEWIQITHEGDQSHSRSIPLRHPSLAPAALRLDPRGNLPPRAPLVQTSRMGKCLPVLLPSFPLKTLRSASAWNEPIQWVESMGEWKLYWAGTLSWKVAGQAPCGSDTCLKLTYTPELHPQVWAAPAWMGRSLHPARLEKGAFEGEALFDPHQGRLISNTLRYAGTLRMKIDDLDAIPWDLRIGRRVNGPGQIVLQFDNKIDVRKN